VVSAGHLSMKSMAEATRSQTTLREQEDRLEA